jgi:hypothetical protein
MHPRERILGYIKYYQDHNKEIPKQVLREAHRWRIEIPTRDKQLANYKLTKNERTSDNEQD